jgi:hypothetical protein
MSAQLKGILWIWFVVQCYCSVVVTASYKAWYSNIPEEALAAQEIFPFLGSSVIGAAIIMLMAMHLAAHIVLVARRKISFVMFCIFVFLPWLVSYLAFVTLFPFFNGIHRLPAGV